MKVNAMMPLSHEKGDKVRIRSGQFAGERGIIVSPGSELINIRLMNDTIICCSSQEVTNYSLAARKAWHTMRKASVEQTLHELVVRQDISSNLYETKE